MSMRTILFESLHYTTVALQANDHLKVTHNVTLSEVYCKGFTDGFRNKSLDGWYFIKDLNKKGTGSQDRPCTETGRREK